MRTIQTLTDWLRRGAVCGAIIAAGVSYTRVQLRPRPDALGAAEAPQTLPYATVADIPRGVWFRGVGVSPSRDKTTWAQISVIDLPFVIIQGERFLPNELYGRFEFTRDPYVPNPVTYPCLMNVELGDNL